MPDDKVLGTQFPEVPTKMSDLPLYLFAVDLFDAFNILRLCSGKELIELQKLFDEREKH